MTLPFAVIRSSVILTAAFLSLQFAHGKVSLPGIFGDHMVLQAGEKIPVWGWADSGESVTVTLGKSSAKTTAEADGRWRVDLDPVGASREPQILTVSGENTIRFEDVLVGQVWLCSGQSNMEFGIFNVFSKKQEDLIDPEIRTFCMVRSASLTPMDNFRSVSAELAADGGMGRWQKGNPVGLWNGFSAVGYLFAKEIRRLTNQPVGMIGSYWGGTPVQAWISQPALERESGLSRYGSMLKNLSPEQKRKFPFVWADHVEAMQKWTKEIYEPYQKATREWAAASKSASAAGLAPPPKPELAIAQPASPGSDGTPATLFNGMINPLVPYAIKGVIWYQGESNAHHPGDYRALFSTLIKDWRAGWAQPNLPFIFVQLAGFETQFDWPLLREAQRQTLALPNTGMATAIDLGEPKNIHPRNKLDVGRRLALLAGKLAYGQPGVPEGPTYESQKIEGNRIRLHFGNVGSGLVIGTPPVLPGQKPAPTPAELTGFEIAGDDQRWVAAEAVIEGNFVLVSSDAVLAPLAVRYAWANYPSCSLYNQEGLPAYPFRTDNNSQSSQP